MRRFEISPATIAAMRSRALAAPVQEVGVALHLELPRYGEAQPAYRDVEANVALSVAAFDPDEDDDFY